jgi:hypothetical protein
VSSAVPCPFVLVLPGMLMEDLDHLGAEDLHQLQRARELHRRVWTAESVTRQMSGVVHDQAAYFSFASRAAIASAGE